MRLARKLGSISLVAAATLWLAPGATSAVDLERTSAAVVAPDSTGVLSAYVGIEGPSVFRMFQAITGRTSLPATQTERLAREHAAALRLLDAHVAQGQAGVVAAVEQVGAVVVSRYTTSVNGLLVHATAAQLSAIAESPGVAFVEPALIVTPALANSVPHIGAVRLMEELGYDGAGSTVAIIDTGVDYTHGQLGGPGVPEAWAAAAAAQETITDTFAGELLFPNAKVIGGWDFVGPRYNPPHICTDAMMAAGTCTNVPEPDPDPLDGGSHGTHVAGIVAGKAFGGLADGVAPGATLVGLKLYGSGGADEAADVLVDAIEWTARINLGIETRGASDNLTRIDAINISLGEGQAQGSRLFDAAVDAAIDAGVVVVASAGNSGDRAFVLGAPSASPRIVSVASSVPPVEGLAIEVTRESGTETHLAVEGSITRPLAEVGRMESSVAYFGQGCPADERVQDVDEKIALVVRGVCNFNEKILAAQAAGAIAVIMFSDGRPLIAMGGDGAGIEIPGVMIETAAGEALRDDLLEGKAVSAVIDPALRMVDHSSADVVSGFSSRGPSRNGALKPDITGPGSGIVSAARGTGSGGANFSGTSMSGPHLAGAAGVMQQRNRDEGLDLGADDVAALMMNYARQVIRAGDQSVPVVRQGAGRVDLVRSGYGDLLVRAGDIASLNIGPAAVVERDLREPVLTLSNIGGDDLSLTAGAAFLYVEDEGAGLSIELPDGPIEVPAGETVEVPVRVVLDPATMREWTLLGPAGASTAPVHALEIDGYVTLEAAEGTDLGAGDVRTVTVPFYALPRRASQLEGGIFATEDPDVPGGHLVEFTNHSDWDGAAELFHVPLVAGEPAAEDPDEADVMYELDIRRVGARVRWEETEGGPEVGRLEFAVTTWEPAAIPQVTRVEVFVDADRDGAPDYRIRDVAGGDAMSTRYARWDDVAGAWGEEAITGTTHVADLHTHVRTLGVPLAALDMDGTEGFDFHVVHHGLNEDWLFTPSTDVAPDGALDEGGPRYAFEPLGREDDLHRWSWDVDGGSTFASSMTEAAAARTWLAVYPSDTFGDERGQHEILSLAARSPMPVYLPLLFDQHAARDGG